MNDQDTAGRDLFKRADELQPDDWIYEPSESGEPVGDPVRVLAVYPFRYMRRVLVVFETVAGTIAAFTDAPISAFRIAAPADLAGLRLRQRRSAAAAGLRDFAALLSRPEFPLPDDDPVDVGVRLDSRAAVMQAAKVLGVEVADGPAGLCAKWPAADLPPQPIQVLVYAPADEGWAYSRDIGTPQAEVVPEGVDGRPVGRAVVPGDGGEHGDC